MSTSLLMRRLERRKKRNEVAKLTLSSPEETKGKKPRKETEKRLAYLPKGSAIRKI